MSRRAIVLVGVVLVIALCAALLLGRTAPRLDPAASSSDAVAGQPATINGAPAPVEPRPSARLAAATAGNVARLMVREMLGGEPLPRVGLVIGGDAGTQREVESDELGFVHWPTTLQIRSIAPRDATSWTCLQSPEQVVAEGVVWLAALSPLEVRITVEGPGSAPEDADHCQVDLIMVGKIDPLTAQASDPWSRVWMDKHSRAPLPTLLRSDRGIYRGVVPSISGMAIRVAHPECYPASAPLPSMGTSSGVRRVDVSLTRLRVVRWRVLADDDRPVENVEFMAQVHFEITDHDEWRRQIALGEAAGGVAATGRPGHYSITIFRNVEVRGDGYRVQLPTHMGRTVITAYASGYHTMTRDVGPTEDELVLRPRRSTLPPIKLTWRARSIGAADVAIIDVTESPLQTNIARKSNDQGEIPGELLEEGRAYLVMAGGFNGASIGLEENGVRGFLVWHGGETLEFSGLFQSIEDVLSK